MFKYKIKFQKEIDFSTNTNLIQKKINSKGVLDLSNDSTQNNQRNTRSNQNYNAYKETSIDSINNSYFINNNLCSIEEKYYKYKNLENPFTIPEIPKNAAKERRTRIINRINKERMNYHSKSVDNAIYKNKLREKRNSYLENNLFGDNDQVIKLNEIQ